MIEYIAYLSLAIGIINTYLISKIFKRLNISINEADILNIIEQLIGIVNVIKQFDPDNEQLDKVEKTLYELHELYKQDVEK